MRNLTAAVLAISLFVSLGSHRSAFAGERFLVTKISGIMALSARHFLLIPEDDSPFCPNLGNPKRYVVSPTSPGMSEDGFRHIYSTSLTAATESLTVTIWFEDSDPNCMVTRIQATFR